MINWGRFALSLVAVVAVGAAWGILTAAIGLPSAVAVPGGALLGGLTMLGLLSWYYRTRG